MAKLEKSINYMRRLLAIEISFPRVFLGSDQVAFIYDRICLTECKFKLLKSYVGKTDNYFKRLLCYRFDSRAIPYLVVYKYRLRY